MLAARLTADVPAWVAAYIGVPFVEHGRDRQGWDCWGLARHVWQEHFGLTVPSYAADYQAALDGPEVSRVLIRELAVTSWQPVDAYQPGDGLLFRIDGWPTHVGVLVARDWFLHCDRGTGTCLDRLTSPRWTRRFLGAYRWQP